MKHNTLGSSPMSISRICLGTMNFGQQVNETDAHEQLDYSLTQGVNCIDTAEAYPIPPEKEKSGNTEKIIGNWIEKRKKRDDFLLFSKVSGIFQAPVIGHRNATAGLTKKNILEAIDGSLSRLKTDYLDLYQVHVPDRQANYMGIRAYPHNPEKDGPTIEETLDALSEIVRTGKARFIGVSNETPWGVSEYLRLAREKGMEKIVSIQNQYSLLNRTYEIGLSEIGHREGVGLLAYSALSMGTLTGKYLNGAMPEGARFSFDTRRIERYNPKRAQPAIEKYVALAQKYDLDPAQMAIAFCLQQPCVASVIIGATTMTQLKTDIDSENVTLSDEILNEIKALYTEYPDLTV